MFQDRPLIHTCCYHELDSSGEVIHKWLKDTTTGKAVRRLTQEEVATCVTSDGICAECLARELS